MRLEISGWTFAIRIERRAIRASVDTPEDKQARAKARIAKAALDYAARKAANPDWNAAKSA